MINRYTESEVAALWTREEQIRLWLAVESAVCNARAARGEIPEEAAQAIASLEAPSVEELDEAELSTRHDVAAFVAVAQGRAGQFGKYIHRGLTSSDIVDTALALQIRDSLRHVLRALESLMRRMRTLGERHRTTAILGRTHGVAAVPTTFGMKVLLHWDELRRNRARVLSAIDTISVGKLSGAIGTYLGIDPATERDALSSLGLQASPISSQVVPRDRHAEVLHVLCQTATTVEKIAVEFRHLARSEIAEIELVATPGQVGSTAMPHKINPWEFETLCGLARVVRGYSHTILENQILWHERDISNSSAERIVFPDATQVTHHMLTRLERLLGEVVVRVDHMMENLTRAGEQIYSAAVQSKLLDAGMTPTAVRAVLDCLLSESSDGSFMTQVLSNESVSRALPREALEECFSLEPYLDHATGVIDRLLLSE